MICVTETGEHFHINNELIPTKAKDFLWNKSYMFDDDADLEECWVAQVCKREINSRQYEYAGEKIYDHEPTKQELLWLMCSLDAVRYSYVTVDKAMRYLEYDKCEDMNDCVSNDETVNDVNILEGYTKSTKDNFPRDECVNQTDEEGVYESSQWYECAIASQKWPEDGFHVQICRPYIWTNGKDIAFGWVHDNQNFWDNYQNPISNNNYGYSVVAFRKMSKKDWDECLKQLSQEITDNQVWED